MQRISLPHHPGKGNKMQSNVSYVVSLELNLLKQKHRSPIEAQQHKHQMYKVNPSHVCTCSESLMIIHVRGHSSFSHFPPLQNKAPGWRSHKLGTWLHRLHLLSYQVLHILTLWKLKLNRGNECLAGCPQWYCTCIWKTGSTPWHRGWDVVRQLQSIYVTHALHMAWRVARHSRVCRHFSRHSSLGIRTCHGAAVLEAVEETKLSQHSRLHAPGPDGVKGRTAF